MRVLSATIHNLRPFGHASINFDDLPTGGVCAVVGVNGSGKSTLVELITSGAMYRKTATHGAIKDMAQAAAYLNVRIENNGQYDITHSVDGHLGKSESVVKDDTGIPLWGDTKVSSFDQWADEHFLSPVVFHSGPFAVQEAAGLCKMKPAERMDALLLAIGCDGLEAKAKACRDRATDASNRLSTCQARLVDEKTRGGDIDAAQADLDAAMVAAMEADADAEMARSAVAALDEALAVLRADVARLVAEVKASESAALEYEHVAAQANARRGSALVSHEAVKSELQTRLVAAWEKAAKFEQATENNRKVLADKEAIEAAVTRAKELDADLASARLRSVDETAQADRWRASEAENRRNAQVSAQQIKEAQARADNAKKRLADRERIENAVVAALAASEQLPSVMAEQAAASAALEELRSVGLVSAEGRILQLRSALVAVVSADCNPVIVAGDALTSDDATVETAREAPAKFQAAKMRLDLADSAYMTIKEAKSNNDRIAALAPTLVAAQTDLDAAETEILASESEESQALTDASAAHEKHLEAVRSVSGIDSEIRAKTAERASLKPKLDLAERLVVASDRLAFNTAALSDVHAEIDSIEFRIDALPLEPPEATQAGEEAAEALERARNVRLTAETAKQALVTNGVTLSEHSKKRGTARCVVDIAEVKARDAHVAEAAAKTRVETAMASSEKVEALILDRRAIEDDLSDWTLLAESLGRTGLQASEVDCAGPALTDLTNSLLHECIGSRWTVTWTTTKLVDKGKREASECNIMVLDSNDGRESPAEQHSPGERAPIELAASLALTMYSCDRLGIERPLLVRDESSSGLDPATSVAYVAMLRKAAKQIGASHTLFISHNPVMWDLADAKIFVENGAIRIGE